MVGKPRSYMAYSVPPLVAPGMAGAGPSTWVMSIALPAAPPGLAEPVGTVVVDSPPPQAATAIIATAAAAITGFFQRISWFLLRCRTPCTHGALGSSSSLGIEGVAHCVAQ